MQLAMRESEALDFCAAQGVAVSALERLPDGGVRLVCSSTNVAEIVRRKAKSKIVSEELAREKHRPASPLW
jgi:hypothetical protein